MSNESRSNYKRGVKMEYIQALQTIGGFVFALVFWLGCTKIEKAINNLKS